MNETPETRQQRKRPKPRRGRVYLRASAWWADFSYRGKRYRRPLENARNEKQAWNALEMLRTEARQGRRLDVEHARWPHLVQRFLSHHEAKGTRALTMRRWRQVLSRLTAFFGSNRVEEVAEHATAYVAHRREQDAKPATIRLELSVIVQAFRIARLPRPELPLVEVRNVRRHFFEPEEVRRLTDRLGVPPERAPDPQHGRCVDERRSISGTRGPDLP